MGLMNHALMEPGKFPNLRHCAIILLEDFFLV